MTSEQFKACVRESNSLIKPLGTWLEGQTSDPLRHHSEPPPVGSERREFPLKLPSNTTVLELMEWSHRQTIDPDETPKP